MLREDIVRRKSLSENFVIILLLLKNEISKNKVLFVIKSSNIKQNSMYLYSVNIHLCLCYALVNFARQKNALPDWKETIDIVITNIYSVYLVLWSFLALRFAIYLAVRFSIYLAVQFFIYSAVQFRPYVPNSLSRDLPYLKYFFVI